MFKANFGSVEIISKGLNWITLPFIAYISTIELYGELASYYSLVAILSMFYIFGQNRFILSSNDMELQENTSLSVYFSALMFIVSIFILLAIQNDPIIYLCSISALLLAIHSNYSIKLRADNNLKSFFIYKLYYFIRLFLLVFLIYLYPNVYVFFIIDSLLLLFFILLTFRPIKVNNIAKIFSRIKRSFMVMCFSFSIVFIMAFDKIFLSKYENYADIGEYSLAFIFASSLTFVASYFAIIHEREIYISKDFKEAEKNRKLFLKRTITSSVVMLPFLFFAYFSYCYILELKSNWIIFLTIYFSQCIYFYCLSQSYIVTYLNEYKILSTIAIISISTNIILNIFLVDYLSILGSAVSNLLTFIAMLLLFKWWRVSKC